MHCHFHLSYTFTLRIHIRLCTPLCAHTLHTGCLLGGGSSISTLPLSAAHTRISLTLCRIQAARIFFLPHTCISSLLSACLEFSLLLHTSLTLRVSGWSLSLYLSFFTHHLSSHDTPSLLCRHHVSRLPLHTWDGTSHLLHALSVDTPFLPPTFWASAHCTTLSCMLFHTTHVSHRRRITRFYTLPVAPHTSLSASLYSFFTSLHILSLHWKVPGRSLVLWNLHSHGTHALHTLHTRGGFSPAVAAHTSLLLSPHALLSLSPLRLAQRGYATPSLSHLSHMSGHFFTTTVTSLYTCPHSHRGSHTHTHTPPYTSSCTPLSLISPLLLRFLPAFHFTLQLGGYCLLHFSLSYTHEHTRQKISLTPSTLYRGQFSLSLLRTYTLRWRLCSHTHCSSYTIPLPHTHHHSHV